MISIFKKKAIPERPDLSELATDMHSHLLPGIDDGSPNVETSIKLMEGLAELGYKRFIATPHILWDIYKNDASTISPAFEELQKGLKEKGLDLPIKHAAEYFLDYHVEELIEEETPLFTITKNWALVEISFVSAPLDLKEKMFSVQMAGYHPILAHPERYQYYAHDLKKYDELKDAGYFFQVNLLSLAGYYGKGPFELAQYLVDKNYVDFLGTDLHHSRHLHALQTATHLTDMVKRLLDSGKLKNHELVV